MKLETFNRSLILLSLFITSIKSVCPENFFFYSYDPLINQSKSNSSDLNGPYWTIIRQTFELCCPLNNFSRKRLNPVRVTNENTIYEKILNSYSREIVNSMTFVNLKLYSTNTSGMFGLVENYESVNQKNGDSFVKILTSSGFYLITKKRLNGFATVKPIVLEVFIEMWPLLLIVLLVYGYMSIMFWSLDRLLELNQFPRSFIQGFCFGLWWLSYHLFTPNSLIAKTTIRSWTIRGMIILWMIICGLLMITILGVFTAALTNYATNGKSLENKIIGVNRYSSDKNWLKLENSLIEEYDSMNDLFADLDAMKLDYILVDEVYIKFYARIIAEKFYVARNVKRHVSFEVLLRGFKKENLKCFHSLSMVISQNWFKNLISFNPYNIENKSKYFNVTDELIYPQVNAVLFVSIGALITIILMGIVWQFTCMKQEETFNAYPFKPNGFNTFLKDDSKKTDEDSMNFYDRALINARDEVILRQQSSQFYSEPQTSNTSGYYRRSPSDHSNHYFQLPTPQQPQKSLLPQYRHQTYKKMSLKDRSMSLFNQTRSFSFRRNKTINISDARSLRNEPTRKDIVQCENIYSVQNIGQDNQCYLNGAFKVRNSILINSSDTSTGMDDTSQTKCKLTLSSEFQTTEESDMSKINCILGDSDTTNGQASSTDSFYLSEFLSVKL